MCHPTKTSINDKGEKDIYYTLNSFTFIINDEIEYEKMHSFSLAELLYYVVASSNNLPG